MSLKGCKTGVTEDDLRIEKNAPDKYGMHCTTFAKKGALSYGYPMGIIWLSYGNGSETALERRGTGGINGLIRDKNGAKKGKKGTETEQKRNRNGARERQESGITAVKTTASQPHHTYIITCNIPMQI